jgi:hypothetical protein
MDARRVVARVVGRRGRSALRRLGIVRPRSQSQWILGIRARGEQRFDEPSGFTPVFPPADRQYADPFIISEDAHRYILVEDLHVGRGRGVISVMTVDDAGNMSAPVLVLDRPYHLSYPFVFRDGADYFMIPETRRNGTVELYRAVEFPYRWSLERTLLQGVEARDSTLLRYQDRYWLFTSMRMPHLINGELSIFSASSLHGRWEPHPQNPVVADARFGRPAGRVFWHADSLIRPAQDCSKRYGEAVVFREILELTPDTYRESPAGRLDPVWADGLIGTHTYNADERFEVIDGLRQRDSARQRRPPDPTSKP